MKRIIFSFVLLISMFVSIAALADSPGNVGSYNWTGFYLGLQGSYDFGHSDWDFPAAVSHTDHTLTGGMGGLLVGYNYQTPVNVVVGIETDFNYGKISGSSSCPNPTYSCNSEADWLGSTRFRAGYAVNRLLPYIAVGVAYTNVYLHGDSVATGVELANTKNNYIGWTPGIGFEFAVTKNLVVRAEYAYYDFGKKSVVLSPPDNETVDSKITFQGVKFGLSWKF